MKVKRNELVEKERFTHVITKELIERFVWNTAIPMRPTHKKICVPIVNRIFKKMIAGVKFTGIKVHENKICDGHHRYLASMLSEKEIDRIPTLSTSATDISSWKLVDFIEDDWDTPAKIELLNRLDADFNNISLEKIAEILK